MIVGSYIPILFWGFSCYPFWRDVYIYSICALGVLGICICWFPIFTTPRFRIVRTSFFMALGWVSLVPVFHLSYLEGAEVVWTVGKFELLMGIIYSIAAFFYASRIPERWYPGVFDYSCSSHVIWHVLIFVAAVLQLWTLIYAHSIVSGRQCTNRTLQLPLVAGIEEVLKIKPGSVVAL
jgi:adiponectin receptor